MNRSHGPKSSGKVVRKGIVISGRKCSSGAISRHRMVIAGEKGLQNGIRKVPRDVDEGERGGVGGRKGR